MALRIRFARDPGESLAYSVERLADGALWTGLTANAFATSAGATAPFMASLPASPGMPGRYEATIPDAITKNWADGNYCVDVHLAATGTVIACLGSVLRGGDDGAVFPAAADLSGRSATVIFK